MHFGLIGFGSSFVLNKEKGIVGTIADIHKIKL